MCVYVYMYIYIYIYQVIFVTSEFTRGIQDHLQLFAFGICNMLFYGLGSNPLKTYLIGLTFINPS